MKRLSPSLILVLGFIILPVHAQNLLIDGDFSANVPTGTSDQAGTTAATINNLATPTKTNPQYQYDFQTSESTYNVGVPMGTVGGWTFTNTGGASNSGIYLI